MGSHFSIVLARNGVTRSVGTFFEHASPLDKLSRYGAACGGPPSLAASRPGYHADFWISGRADFGIIWRTAKRLFSSPDLAWVRPGACLRVAGAVWEDCRHGRISRLHHQQRFDATRTALATALAPHLGGARVCCGRNSVVGYLVESRYFPITQPTSVRTIHWRARAFCRDGRMPVR